jgi:hypothetical protein
MALVLLVSFCVGHVIAWAYMWTHRGVSYTQGFVVSLVTIPVIMAFVMSLLSSNITIAFGLLAVFAVVRFRNVLKDTRDTVFVLWAISEGLAVGTLHFGIAILGCVAIALIHLYLSATAFGRRLHYDVVLMLRLTGGAETIDGLKAILLRHSSKTELASQRSLSEQEHQLSYRLLLRNPSRSGELVTELNTTGGVDGVSLHVREDELEL